MLDGWMVVVVGARRSTYRAALCVGVHTKIRAWLVEDRLLKDSSMVGWLLVGLSLGQQIEMIHRQYEMRVCTTANRK
jgi:hypothetical protein